MTKFFHGSYIDLSIGTVLKPKEHYAEFWGETDFYSILEKYRPSNMMAHSSSVFLCDNPEDIDNAGGATEWLFHVIPGKLIEKHDQHWCSEISIATCENKDDSFIANLAHNYWQGISSKNPVWEYLTNEATIIFSEEY